MQLLNEKWLTYDEAAMLNLMRRHAYSWLTRGILFLIVVVFAFWGIGTGFFAQVHPVATVDGHQILADQVDLGAERLRKVLQNVYGPNAAALLKRMNLRQQALDELIQQLLIAREARRIGLEIGDAALQKQIAENHAFQVAGHFDFATYQEVLRQNDLLPAQFEAETRADLLATTLRDMIGQAIEISDAQARLEYDRRNEKLKMAYVEIPFDRFQAAIQPTEQQIADFYKKNGEQFREPDRVKMTFIHYDPAVLAETVNPSQQDIQDYYNRYLHTSFTHPDQVHARHILISVPAGANENEKSAARAKAEEVLKQLKSGADFSQLAEKYSDDEGNKHKGGDLGLFSHGQMVKPFEEAAFKLKAGEVSGIVETQFGYHLIKADEIKPAHVDSLEEARPKILQALKQKGGSEIAHNALREDLDAALSGANLKELASKRGLQAIETPSIPENQPVKGTERNPEVLRAAFKMDKGDVRAITGQGVDGYLVKVLEKQVSFIPKLADIHDAVRAALVRARAEQMALEQGQALLKLVKAPADLAKVASGQHLEVKDTVEFSRATSAIPAIGDFPEVTTAAGAVANVPGVIDHVFEHGGNSYIFEVTSRTPPGDDEWQKAEAAFKQELLQARRTEAWNRFMESLKLQAKIMVDVNQIGETPAESSM